MFGLQRDILTRANIIKPYRRRKRLSNFWGRNYLVFKFSQKYFFLPKQDHPSYIIECIYLLFKIILRIALEECADNKIAESINLQIQFHIKQQQIIRIKQINYYKFTKNLENLQIRMQKANIQEADALQVRILLKTQF